MVSGLRTALLLILLYLLPMQVVLASEKVEVLFVQMSGAMEFDGNKITLSDIAPHVVWYTERPDRKSGHMTLDEFLTEWEKGTNSFEVDPPNAVLTLMDASDSPAVIVIRNPIYRGKILTYDVEILNGSIPKTGGPVSLVIDGKVIGIDLGKTL
ncbi:MAG: hypothetical protein NXI13_07590 [Proteobacteria bacterium]|nr:hypothetical protein [Pseudomonadota bacterium]